MLPEKEQEHRCPCYSELAVRIDRLEDNSDTKAEQIGLMHKDMTMLRGEVHDLRADVRALASSTQGIEESLRTIASSMQHMSDLPVVWSRIKGFWAVLSWIRSNALTMVFLAAVLVLAVRLASGVELFK